MWPPQVEFPTDTGKIVSWGGTDAITFFFSPSAARSLRDILGSATNFARLGQGSCCFRSDWPSHGTSLLIKEVHRQDRLRPQKTPPFPPLSPCWQNSFPRSELPISLQGAKTRMSFPINRPRRIRRTEALRGLVRETRLTTAGFIYPMFVCPGHKSSQGSQFDAGDLPAVRGSDCGKNAAKWNRSASQPSFFLACPKAKMPADQARSRKRAWCKSQPLRPSRKQSSTCW